MAVDPNQNNDPNQNGDPKTKGDPTPANEGGEGNPAGGPDASKAAEKYKQQRDEARTQLAEMQKRIEELSGSAEEVEKLKEELKAEREKAEQDAREAERNRVNGNRLVKEGCVDVDVALGLLDENGDVDKLKEEKPYLFTAQSGSTGLKPAGAANDEDEDDALLDRAMGIVGKK